MNETYASTGPGVIIGAGPAGLTAAYERSKHDVGSVILEADTVTGGISRTAEYRGYLFDNGVLNANFITGPCLPQIYYRSRQNRSISCAAQRIKRLSLTSVIVNALTPGSRPWGKPLVPRHWAAAN